jgi:hypothetical protein
MAMEKSRGDADLDRSQGDPSDPAAGAGAEKRSGAPIPAVSQCARRC